MAIKKIENLNIHENPSTNTNAFDIENYLNANWDTVKQVINNNADELEQAQNRILELQNENTTLKNQIPSGEEVGNPIHLSDSSDMECEIVPIGGAEQETRSGNLYNSSTNVSGYISSTGDITSNNNWIVTDYISVIALINYYTAGNTNLTAGEGVYGAYYNSNKELISTFPYSNYKTETATIAIPENAAYIRFSLYKYADNTATFDFYTDAQTPNYPSKVVTVGQNVNMFDKDNANTLNAIINGTTKQIANFDTCRSIYISCDNNEDYTISRKAGTRFVVGTTTNTPVLNATCNQIVQNNTADSITIKTTENDNYLVVFYYNSGTDTLTEQEILDSIKIEKGSKATAYSPYGQGSVEIEVCNKNEFNCKETYTNNGITLTKNSDGSFEISGTATQSGSFRICDYFKIKGNYTFSYEVLKGNSSVWFWNQTDSNSNLVFNGTMKRTAEFTEEKELALAFSATAGTNYSFTARMQIEKGSTATDYIPHQSYAKVLPIQKEFVKIGDVEDTFIKQDGKWYEKHCSPKIVFDGINNKFNTKVGITANNLYYSNVINGVAVPTNNSVEMNLLCNYFNKTTANKLYSNDLVGCAFTTGKTFSIGFGLASNITTVELANAWLQERNSAGNPLEIYYPLETPELIPCTEEQESILNSFYTYKGVTNVSMSGIGKIKIIYKQDQQTINKNYENRLAALEAAIIS